MHCHPSLPEIDPELERLGRQRGFTLVEILVTLVVLALISVITVANMHRAMVKSRTNRGLRSVNSAVDFARTEALKRHSPVGVVFGQSMVVFEDWDGAASNGVFDNPGDPLISTWNVDETLTFGTAPATDSDTKTVLTTVVYESDGALGGPAGGGAAYLTDIKGNIFRVRVNPITGASRTEMWDSDDSKWSARRETWKWKY
jgi:prepilin-type N-terminal cleavage/methylation domain-containing protein